MSQARRSVAGEVAVVLGGGEGPGRAIALALAAREVRVVVAGGDERALGRVVGEVTAGGGAARHLAGDASSDAHVAAAVARAVDAFGRLSWIVAGADAHVDSLDLALRRVPRQHGRLVLVASATAADADPARQTLAGRVTAHAPGLRAVGATCNGLVWTGDADADLDHLGEIAVFLCSHVADGVTGQVLVVSG